MHTTSTVTPRDVATALFEALNRHDLDAAMAMEHDDIVEDFVAVGSFEGVSAVRGFFAEIFSAVPDFRLEVLEMVCDDDHAVVQWRARGTFTGTPFRGIHATGRRVQFRGVDVMPSNRASSPTTPCTTTGWPSPARSACCPVMAPCPTGR